MPETSIGGFFTRRTAPPPPSSEEEKAIEIARSLSIEMCGYPHYDCTSSGFTTEGRACEIHGGRIQAHYRARAALAFYGELFSESPEDPLYKERSEQSSLLYEAIESFAIDGEGRPFTLIETVTPSNRAGVRVVPAGAARHVYRLSLTEGYIGTGDRVVTLHSPPHGFRVEQAILKEKVETILANSYSSRLATTPCPRCSHLVTRDSLAHFPELVLLYGSRHSRVCRECLFSAWRERGRLSLCGNCAALAPEFDLSPYPYEEGSVSLCTRCNGSHYVCETCGSIPRHGEGCETCEERDNRSGRIADVRTKYLPSKCEWEKDLPLLTPAGRVEMGQFFAVSRKQGEVSNNGIEEIASLLRSENFPITWTSNSPKEGEAGRETDVTKDITYVHGPGMPSVAKAISSLYFRHYRDSFGNGRKLAPSVMEEIGSIAARNTAKESEIRHYALTRDFDRPREFYCHDASCWWSEKPLAFCYMKQYGGMLLISRDSPREARDDYDECLSRGAVLPLYRSGDGELWIESDDATREPSAYFLFNVYGEDGYNSMAGVLSEMTGMGQALRIEIAPVSSRFWINGRITTMGELSHSFGHLILPEGASVPETKRAGSKVPFLHLTPNGESATLLCKCKRRHRDDD
jgi:hypothetical protein